MFDNMLPASFDVVILKGLDLVQSVLLVRDSRKAFHIVQVVVALKTSAVNTVSNFFDIAGADIVQTVHKTIQVQICIAKLPVIYVNTDETMSIA